MFIQAQALCFLTTTHCPHMGDKVPDAQTFTEKNAHWRDASMRVDPSVCLRMLECDGNVHI